MLPAGGKRCAEAFLLQNVFQLQYVPQCTFSLSVSDRAAADDSTHTVIVVIIISSEILIFIIKCILAFVVTILLFSLICL